MMRVALKGLAGRKLRSALTALAIVLGVAMVSGTFVLTDTIDRGYDTVFSDAYAQSDVVITPQEGFGQEQAGAGGFPASVLQDVQGLPVVDAAAGAVVDQARLIDRDGEVMGAGGMAPMAFGIDPRTGPELSPLTLVRGRWPQGAGEVAIDKAAARDAGFRLGDPIRVATRGPAKEYRIAGLVQLGGAASLGGATVAMFDLRTAQSLFRKAGRLDVVRVTAADGVEDAQLLRTIRPELPPATQLRTADAQAQAESGDTSEGLGFLRYFLLAFGGVALFVGSFVIANTLSITIAQRTRELATLRTLGASRRQVLTSVVVEAVAVGVLASVAGLFAGLGLAQGLSALLVGAGIDLPSSGAVLATRTIVVSLLVGVLITLVASVRPAVRATRVAPIAAGPRGRDPRADAARALRPAGGARGDRPGGGDPLGGRLRRRPRVRRPAARLGRRHAAAVRRRRAAGAAGRATARLGARLAGGAPGRRRGSACPP
jgi:putative ABC transport system permease protein